MKKTTTMLLISIILLGLLSIIYPIQTCSANTLSVDINGELQYSSIQEAINNATTGDTIYIYQGTYYENLKINKSIILTGENKLNTIIMGGTSGDIIQITVDNVEISDLTIKNPIGTDMKCLKLLEVENCIISNNMIENGNDGIFLSNSNSNTITENTIENNVANGIYAYNCDNNEIYDNIIKDNGVSGIRLINSNNNLLYLNHILINLNSNAYDNSNNDWYTGNQGNYWDDYNDYDSDNDGIGDTAYSISGGSNKDEKPLGYFLNQKPTAYIQAVSPNPAIVGQTISFQGFSTDDGSIIQWEWKAGSHTVGTQEDSQYSGLPAGTYTVTFRVKDNDETWSDIDIYEQTLIVNAQSNNNQENQAPTAHITTISPSSPIYGQSVHFQGYGEDSDGTITTYYWTSNLDGEIGQSNSFYRSDLSIGTHTISLKVRDNQGKWSNTATRNVTVIQDSSNPENVAPVANAGGPYTAYTNETVNFDATNSYDTDGAIISYKWSFGDGNTGSGLKTSNKYTNPGTYYLTLTVTDNNASTNTNTTTVTVQNKQENNTDNETSDKWIPGFEAIIALLAITIISIIKKKKN